MNNFKFLLAISLTSVVFFSCGDDDDDDSPPEFINQVLQGKINAKDWQAVTGIAEPSSFEANQLSIQIGAEEIADVCDEFFLEGLKVIFSAPDAVGTYEFELGSQTITLFDPEGTLNIIIVEGVLEIQTIDATEGGSVTGRIVGQSDSDNIINGNFTATYCPG